MHLRSISLKGFKSFPDRTTLEFAPGVAVIVGPNGSGKSNVTDAVLWALGEQSALAVRGQSMQDVIFAGGHGVGSRSAAEVEVVIADAEGGAAGFSELSILRRIDRSGNGEYRLNGARCRLVDVLEALSDTGLGKEMHSVVSQGRIEAIVHSQARDRRLLIEEAAGLGKHRKRRRRAELKLARTEDNLARALDVEREARARLRPLHRQAEAAELHARLERQSLEAELALGHDALAGAEQDLAAAEAAATAARARARAAEEGLAAVAVRRTAAEEALAAHARAREDLSSRTFAARSAAERIAMRRERANEVEHGAREGQARRAAELEQLGAALAAPAVDDGHEERIRAMQAELRGLEEQAERRIESEVTGLEEERARLAESAETLSTAVLARREELGFAEAGADAARRGLRAARIAASTARDRAAQAGAELAATTRFLRAFAPAPGGGVALADELGVGPDDRAAVAAVLGPRLRAALVSGLGEARDVLDSAGAAGGAALLSGSGHASSPDARRGDPPAPGAVPLLARISPSRAAAEPAERLLGHVWLVDSLEALAEDFRGVAVTPSGRVYDGSVREVRQAVHGEEDRLLAALARRDELVSASTEAASAEAAALAGEGVAAEAVVAADAVREEAEGSLRLAARERDAAADALEALERRIRHRREAPGEGPDAVRRAELTSELRAARLGVEQATAEQARRTERAARLRLRLEADAALLAAAGAGGAALGRVAEAVEERRLALEAELHEGQAAGEAPAARLRECALEEPRLQEELRHASAEVTATEVSAQRLRDARADAGGELDRVAGLLGVDPAAPAERLTEEERADLGARVERVARRRAALGPVNPLAESEYAEAVEHVEELEAQRTDLETALAELQGLIRDTDKAVRESFEETFAATARNFEEVVPLLFPGGRGRLRLVRPEGPRAVLGGGDEPADTEPAEHEPAEQEAGVEVEVTPAGKSTKRLSLLSGGEKSLVALAFLFAVFLARPCPFYILDEVEAALDDLNIDRFLRLVTAYSKRAQFIVVTHQKRTMDAADRVYGVSMGADGVSKVVSRRLARAEPLPDAHPAPEETEVA